MLQRATNSALGIYLQVAGVVSLVIVAAIAGWLLGGRPFGTQDTPVAGQPSPKPAARAPVPARPVEPPPLYFHAHFPSGAAQSVVTEEVAMAASAGIHQYVIDVPLPWEGDMNAFLGPITLVTQTDPKAAFFLQVDLNPPPAWLEVYPEETLRVAGKDGPYASPASEVWRRDARSALEALVSAMSTSERPESLLGYVVGCLDSGRWYRAEGYDTSAPNLAAFRNWLTAKYKENEAIQQAWADPDATLETIAIPAPPDTANTCRVFFDGPEMQRQIDFLQYTSDVTADAILVFVRGIKQAGGSSTPVMAPYGYTYELTANGAGHFALSRLLDSEIDGFVSPISYVDRGLGGAGGMMGPVHSVIARKKKWLLIDDTRTGLARDPATGEIARPKNLRAEDVYSVQQRNFATALTQELGLIWSDPEGDGWLHEAAMWQGFGKMWGVYRNHIQESAQAGSAMPLYPSGPTLAVVADETSRFYQQCDKKMNEVLLNQVRDCAVRAGVPTTFYLLRDVIDKKVPPAQVYLFLNAFRLTSQDREQLHAVLQETKPAVIWMYAPGYIDKTASAENISATTRIRTKMFDGPAQAGSVWLLPANWIGKDEEFGPPLEVQPLFYIQDPDTNVIANFRASGKASVAMSFFEDSWTSIFCAEPSLTTPVLRQILRLLELPVIFQVTPVKFYDATYFGTNLLAFHAKETGERIVELERICDVQDLLAAEIGWPRKGTLNIPLKTGETRLLRLTPIEEETPLPSEPQTQQ